MPHAEAIIELIRLLRHFADRPALYIRPVDIQNARSFLSGISFSFQVLTGSFTREELDADVRSRGWLVSERSTPLPEETLEHQMNARGMSEVEMIAELVEIRILSLRRRAETAA